MRKLILTLIVSSAYFLVKTPVAAQTKRILYASDELHQQTPPLSPIHSISRTSMSSFLKIRYADGRRQRIPVRDVWGFVDNGTIYRRVGKSFMAVIDQKPGLIEYSSDPVPYYDVVTKATIRRKGPHYFSTSLDGQLYKSEKAARRENK